ncbi:single-stranded DNA-binding protein [Ihubacter massiliensis]|uniref:single-stranded DNA-binding protein n=1 Tax=Ihubacter massiliensis TaxID=1852367 RepID=UPI002097F43E|nr:single-stranded DNA-binding protein [Ihubacter massiliensis]MCO7124147.1 single-stranded DNA-binding protein [Ihubacter massiliensis]MDY3013518.1 single-stranded DNA-binding protein [Clostridiales Family XIII bacterium]
MNSVVLIGRLTKNPDVRYTTDGIAVARFSVAINRPAKADRPKQTDFPNVVVFGKQAENCERFLNKGRLVGIQGRIQTGKYTNKDGAAVYTTDVVANNVEFLDWGESEKQKSDRQKEYDKQSEDIPEGFQAVDPEDCPF